MQRLIERLKRLRFRQRWLLAYAALLIAPLAALTFFSYSRVSAFIREQVRSSTAAAVDRAVDSIAARLDLAARLTTALYSDQRVRDILARPSSPYPVGAQIEDYWYLETVCRSLARAGDDVARIRLYVGPDRIYSNENVVIHNLASIAGSETYARVTGGRAPVYGARGSLAIDGSQAVEVVSFLRAIRSFADRSTVTGIVSVDVRAESFEVIARQTIAAAGGAFYVFNDADEPVVSLLLPETAAAPDAAAALTASRAIEDGGLGPERQTGGGWETARGLPLGWRLYVRVPFGEIFRRNARWRFDFLLVLAAVSAAACLLAFYVSGFDTRRLARLAETMRTIQEGELTKVAIDGRDEIGELQEDFNLLVDRLRGALEERYRIGQDVKNAELQTLQAQINPHFLYNTLDLLKWRASQGDTEAVVKLVDRMAGFYRLSLAGGRSLVTLREEVRHVQTYVEIQNERFDGAISFETAVEPRLLDCLVPKLTLQPLIENAVVHGVREKPAGRGTILLSGSAVGADIEIVVWDDGPGMDDAAIRAALAGGSRSDRHSFGVRNINQRLRLLYGERYGVRYDSSQGQGTRAIVLIPATRQD